MARYSIMPPEFREKTLSDPEIQRQLEFLVRDTFSRHTDEEKRRFSMENEGRSLETRLKEQFENYLVMREWEEQKHAYPSIDSDEGDYRCFRCGLSFCEDPMAKNIMGGSGVIRCPKCGKAVCKPGDDFRMIYRDGDEFWDRKHREF